MESFGVPDLGLILEEEIGDSVGSNLQSEASLPQYIQ
jgi:hypothetical protein